MVGTTVLRGLLGRCPCCGEGKLFGKYLKVHEFCPTCQEPLTSEGSDDAPAYLTIVLMGHFFLPVLIYTELKYDMPLWVLTGVALPAFLGLTLAILPRAKGMVVALLWFFRKKKG